MSNCMLECEKTTAIMLREDDTEQVQVKIESQYFFSEIVVIKCYTLGTMSATTATWVWSYFATSSS